MYIIPPVHELTIVGVFDAGSPNLERIVLRPTESLNLAGFALILGVPLSGGGVTPLADQFFWFGEKWISPPSWVVVFTGPGQFREGTHPTSGEPVLELHWGRGNVVFGSHALSVSIVRLGGISSHLLQPSQEVPKSGKTFLPYTRG